MGGTLVQTNSPLGTCRHQGAWSNYTYFVVHPALADRVKNVEIVEDWASKPHKPVCLTMKLKAEEKWTREKVKPRALPMVKEKAFEEGEEALAKWPTPSPGEEKAPFA